MILSRLSRYISFVGINFTANTTDLYAVNYPPMLTQLTKLLANWSSLPLAWMGRITVIKMSILPKFTMVNSYTAEAQILLSNIAFQFETD